MATSDADPCARHGCAACCYDTEMTLTARDVARLEVRGHRAADFAWRDPQGFLLLRNVEDAAGGRHCYFLRGGRCSVYADRPQGCRLYPFVLDADNGRAIRDKDCPHRGEFASPGGVRRRLTLLWERTAAEAAARNTEDS